MECCVGVSRETVLQIDKFYAVVTRIFELTFWNVALCWSRFPMYHSLFRNKSQLLLACQHGCCALCCLVNQKTKQAGFLIKKMKN